MLIKILVDAYKFFDRQWSVITATAILSFGLAGALNFIINLKIALPSLSIPITGNKPLELSYNDIFELVVFFLINIWFEGFIALLAHAEVMKEKTGFTKIAMRLIKLYPKALFANAMAQIVIFSGLFLAIPALSLGYLGVFLIIPAFLFMVWFSLVTPIAVIDDVTRVDRMLFRSRLLVHGYFLTILAVIMISIIPSLAIVEIQSNSPLFWPVTMFVRISSAIIGATMLAFSYINLRTIKENYLTDSTSDTSQDLTDTAPDA